MRLQGVRRIARCKVRLQDEPRRLPEGQVLSIQEQQRHRAAHYASALSSRWHRDIPRQIVSRNVMRTGYEYTSEVYSRTFCSYSIVIIEGQDWGYGMGASQF